MNSSCDFLQELTYPEIIEVAVKIDKIGNSSINYNLAIFKQNQEQAAAQGNFTHVFVDRQTKKSTTIPLKMRDALNPFLSRH